MKRFLTATLLVASLARAGGAEASLDRSAGGVRAQGMGGAFVSVADDGSALFVNPAGMVSARWAAAYLDYAEPRDLVRESRLGLAASVGATSIGFGWYRRSEREVATGDLLVVGAARRLLEGTQGSFFSVGASVVLASASFGGGSAPAGGRSTAMSADAGIILRPLPVISVGCSLRNIRNVDLDAARGEAWSRVQRWGVSYFWEERIILSFEDEHRGRSSVFHYGLSVKTAVPVELMAGFSEGSATGGVRWTGSRLRAAVSFESGGNGAVTWMGSCEVAFHRNSPGGTR